MSDKFRDKFRISSTRLPHWDYSDSGYYFITICTKDKEEYFGEIIKNEIILTEIGEIAKKCWMEIPNHFPCVELDEFVVMPNHIHGIIIIRNRFNGGCRDVINHVSTKNVDKNKFSIITPMGKHNLGEIIRWYKGRSTFEIRKKYPNFSWQPRYYDHVIRNEKEYYRVKQYIRDNPKNWDEDKNNSDENYLA